MLYHTVNLALCNKLSVPVQSNCATAVRTGNWVLYSEATVGIRPISAPVVTVLQVFSGVHVAAVV